MLPARGVADEIRDLVKTVYGDEWDVCVTNTAEAALRIAYEALMAPPTMRKGDAYRTRVLQVLGEDFEWGAGYGRPFPPRYKNVAMDRTVAGGELGLEGKSLANLDTLFVRAPGVRYEVHGVPAECRAADDRARRRRERRPLQVAAERHASMLAGVHAVGYDTPGWGFGEKDGDGVPLLMKSYGGVAPGLRRALRRRRRDLPALRRPRPARDRRRRHDLLDGQGRPLADRRSRHRQGGADEHAPQGDGLGRAAHGRHVVLLQGGVLGARPGARSLVGLHAFLEAMHAGRRW